MTIRRIGGCVAFECDECGDVLETRETEFQEALAESREAGWRYLGDELHSCPECDERTAERVSSATPDWLKRRGRK
jgi:predicted RNA-binding Zn-ribbon protein involved in translation (DUF1610 family)